MNGSVASLCFMTILAHLLGKSSWVSELLWAVVVCQMVSFLSFHYVACCRMKNSKKSIGEAMNQWNGGQQAKVSGSVNVSTLLLIKHIIHNSSAPDRVSGKWHQCQWKDVVKKVTPGYTYLGFSLVGLCIRHQHGRNWLQVLNCLSDTIQCSQQKCLCPGWGNHNNSGSLSPVRKVILLSLCSLSASALQASSILRCFRMALLFSFAKNPSPAVFL